jgi:uncharacterized membrane protein YeaQ/YmgE (transglycosylase-associated protein family)
MEGIINIIAWIIVGGIAGWIASMIAGQDARQGWVTNVIVGIVGAFIGGLILSFLGFGPLTGPFRLETLIAAIIGAVILLFIVRMFQGRA